MNIPSLVTISRIILILPIIYLTSLGGYFSNIIALGLFLIAGATDFLDGYIARKTNAETRLGALLDLLADKLLVCTLLIWLVSLYGDLLITIPVIIIISRELVISSLRQFIVEQDKNNVLKVSLIAKSKTTLQIISIAMLIIAPNFKEIIFNLSVVILWSAALFSLFSLYDYLKKWFKEFFKNIRR